MLVIIPMALLFPSIEQIELLPVPLEPGEKFLLNFLVENLDDEYEIYIQPFLNGDRPDIVIIRQGSGVLVIEVKDWHLKHYANINGGLSSWQLIKNGARIRSPLAQARGCNSKLRGWFFKQVGEQVHLGAFQGRA